MNRVYLYCITNTTNGKVYIGKTKLNPPEKRWERHLKDSKYYRYYLYNAIRKYGPTSFSFEVIAVAFSHEAGSRFEELLIKQYNSMDAKIGYNLTVGGEGGYFSEESRKKMSAAQMGNKKNLGKRASDEKRRLIAKANEVRVWKETSKTKIGESNKKKSIFQTPGFREKMRQLYLNRQRDAQGKLLPCQ